VVTPDRQTTDSRHALIRTVCVGSRVIQLLACLHSSQANETAMCRQMNNRAEGEVSCTFNVTHREIHKAMHG